MTKPRELVSKKTRQEFREHLVDWSTLGGITDHFDSADIPCRDDHQPKVSGARRSLVEQYYASLDCSKAEDVAKLLQAYASILARVEERGPFPDDREIERRLAERDRLVGWLRKDGFTYSDGRISRLPGVEQLSGMAAKLDAPYLMTQIRRMEDAIETDPRLAIGTAKELVETTCKTILAELKRPVDPALELTALVKATRAALKLLPGDVPDQAKAADTIRRVLSNLGTVVQGLAELRNSYGTGHGPHGKPKGLLPRHARLAAGAASLLATFLLETHEERNIP